MKGKLPRHRQEWEPTASERCQSQAAMSTEKGQMTEKKKREEGEEADTSWK